MMKNTVARILALLSLVVTLAMPSLASAQGYTFYVAPTGSDTNPGTLAQPWGTLRHAVAQLRAGDTLYLRGGTYTGAANVIDSQTASVPSGTSWASAVTIAGYPGEVAAMQPPNNMSAIRLTTGAPHYLVFQDFEINMTNNTVVAHSGGADGVYVANGSHHNRFLRLTVHDNVANCFQLTNSQATAESRFNEIVDSTIHTCGNVHGGGGDSDAYAIYNSTDDTRIEGNDIYNIGAYGITAYGSRHIIRNNRIHQTGVASGDTSFAIVIGSSAHTSASLDVQIYNNLLYDNLGGIMLYSNSGRAQVYNNTIANNRVFEGIATLYYAAGSTIRNNIVVGNGAAIVDYGPGGHTIDHNLEVNPRFVNAAAGDFQLQSTSAARDAGATISVVTTDFAGTARLGTYDIGAFEYADADATALSAPVNLRVVQVQ
jgi:parallel beta-helix repeat protein